MYHYLLLKLEPGCNVDDMYAYAKDIFGQLERQVSEIISAQVLANCIERSSNMDLMIRMEFKEAAALNIYLDHELHKAFSKHMNAFIVSRVTFDYEMG